MSLDNFLFKTYCSLNTDNPFNGFKSVKSCNLINEFFFNKFFATKDLPKTFLNVV